MKSTLRRFFATLTVLGAVGLAVAGCNTVAKSIDDAGTKVANAVGVTNNSLASLAENNIPTACGIIAVAEGYFHQLKGNISAENIAIEQKAEAAVKVICDNPPKNVAQAFGTLLNLWLTIQSATKA
jgi:predicted small secreted protein